MGSAVLGVLFIAATVTCIQVDFAPQAASSHVYRNDYNGPASLVELGAHSYEQPHAFAAPYPLAQPVKFEGVNGYDLGPAPLPYVSSKSIEDDDDSGDSGSSEDDDDEDLLGYGHGGHGYAKGAGSDYGEEHHAAHGAKGDKGFNSKGHFADAKAGHYGKAYDEGHYSEADGKKKKHFDEADAHGKHYEASKGYKGGDHGHKKHFSKGEDVTGYHKVFHKDEFKKDHDFYDNADKSGHFKKYGYAKAHHGSEKGAHKEGGHHDAAFDKGGFGKAGFYNKGHVDDHQKGHSAEEGGDSHFKHHDDFGKKGSSGHEKAYAYDDDDDKK